MKNFLLKSSLVVVGGLLASLTFGQTSYCVDDFSTPFPNVQYLRLNGNSVSASFNANSIAVGQVWFNGANQSTVGTPANPGDTVIVSDVARTVARNTNLPVLGKWRTYTLLPTGNPSRTSEAYITNNKLYVDNGFMANSVLKVLYGNANNTQPFTASVDLTAYNQFVINDFHIDQYGSAKHVSVVMRVISFDVNNVRTLKLSRFNMSADGAYVIPFSAFPGVDFSRVFRVTFDFEANVSGTDWELGTICATNSVQNNARLANFTSVIEEQAEINIYPVPTKDILFIDVSSMGVSKVAYEIFDLKGQLVASNAGLSILENNIFQINTTNLSNGAYLLKVMTDGQVVAKKFIINN